MPANPARVGRANPYQFLRPIPPADFVGRWPMVQEIANNLILEGGESHAVVAGRRCGKSSLLLALADQLRKPDTAESGDWLPLPIPFDFKSSSLSSGDACLAEMLDAVRRRVDAAARRRPPDAWPETVALDASWFQALAQANELPLRDFQDCIGYILDQLSSPLRPVRLVLLLDEMDELLGHPWTDAIFNQMRALVYSSDLKDQVRLVLTGSRRFLDEVSDRGSPLWNVLMFHYLPAIDQASVAQLSERARQVWPGGLPGPVAEAVWTQSGGQPFLAQYLLYQLCQAAPEKSRTSEAPADPATVQAAVEKFIHERLTDLEGWARAIEPTGLAVYHLLLQSTDWLAETEIVRLIANPQMNVKRGLIALCYHGVAIHDGGWGRYRRTGDLFKTWFEANAASFLAQNAPPSGTHTPPQGSIYAQTVILGGQVQVGDDISIGVIQDSQGVAIGRQASAEVEKEAEKKRPPSSQETGGRE